MIIFYRHTLFSCLKEHVSSRFTSFFAIIIILWVSVILVVTLVCVGLFSAYSSSSASGTRDYHVVVSKYSLNDDEVTRIDRLR